MGLGLAVDGKVQTGPQPAAYLGRRALELLDRGTADWDPMEGLVVAERRRELALSVV